MNTGFSFVKVNGDLGAEKNWTRMDSKENRARNENRELLKEFCCKEEQDSLT